MRNVFQVNYFWILQWGVCTRKRKILKAGCVINGHCMIQFSSKQSHKRTLFCLEEMVVKTLCFWEFCFLKTPLSTILKCFLGFFSWPGSTTQRRWLPRSPWQGTGPSCWTSLLSHVLLIPDWSAQIHATFISEEKCSQWHKVLLKISNLRETGALCRE